MKSRKLLILMAAFLLLSTTTVMAAPTSAEDARLVVTNWLALDAQPLGFELGSGIKEVKTYEDGAGQPLYHIVYLATNGFVIVAGDDLVEPIIGFLFRGTYNPSWDNPLGALVDRDVAGRVTRERKVEQTAVAGGLEFALDGKSGEARRKWDWLKSQGAQLLETVQPATISDVRVTPFVQSKWSQGDVAASPCYNYYTPNNYPSGCVATALSQLMRYHRHPSAGVGTGTAYAYYEDGSYREGYLRGGDGGGGAYNWNNMPMVPGSSITPAQRQAIGSLMWDAGLSVGMDYAAAGSGANTLDTADALKNIFGYSNAIRGYNPDWVAGIPIANLKKMINPNLDASLPVLLGINGNSGGHAIVTDGYGYNASTLYHHLNMGWSGYDDAWYNLPDITAGYTFDIVYKCIYNVYKSGSGEIISGRVLDAAGNPVSGATVTARRSGVTTRTATTNSKGVYALTKIPSVASYTISVTKTGYSFASKTVSTRTSYDDKISTGNLWGVDFTQSSAKPSVTTPVFSSVDTTKAMLGATIQFSGGSAVSSAGVAYGTSAKPGISGSKVTTPITSGVFTVNVTGLTPNTLYHFRGYATNSFATSYSTDSTFTTRPTRPTATGGTSVSQTTFCAHWKAPSGTAAITGYRLDVSTDSNFGSFVTNYRGRFVSGTSRVVYGLSAGETYYYRVRAVNAGGVSTSSKIISITTLE
ncbi:MAG: C10 family peptidase [Syntrophobacteraceae bacterium]